MHVGWVSTYAPPEDGPATGLRRDVRRTSPAASRTRRAGGRSSRRCRSGCTSRRGSTTPTSIPPSTSCTRRAATSTRSSTSGLLRAAAARPPAVAVLDRRRAARRQLAHDLQGPPLHGRRHRDRRARQADPRRRAVRGPRRGRAAWEPVPAPSRNERFARGVVRPRRRRRVAGARAAASSRPPPGAAARRPRARPHARRTRCSRPRPTRRSTAPARRTAATCG